MCAIVYSSTAEEKYLIAVEVIIFGVRCQIDFIVAYPDTVKRTVH